MSQTILLRRGTEAERLTLSGGSAPAAGEVLVTTDNYNELFIGDGSTTGGVALNYLRTTGATAQSIAGNVTVSGNLTVSGTTTTVNSNEVNIGDAVILLNSDYSGSAASESAGFEIERDATAGGNTSLLWDEGNDYWALTDLTSSRRILDTADLDPGSSQLFYKTFTADTSSTAASANEDSIAIVGSAGITTTATADTITINGYTAGTGIALDTSTLSLDFTELTDMTGDVSGTTEIILNDSGTESRKAISEIDLSFFDNTTSAFSTTVGTVTSVAALTIGTAGTDLGSSVATGTTTPVITLNVPDASTTNRGALTSTDWDTFNAKVTSISAGTGLTDGGTAKERTLSVNVDDTTIEHNAGNLRVKANSITTNELAIADQGTSGQVLTSDQDGTMSWSDAGAATNNATITLQGDDSITATESFTTNQNTADTLNIGHLTTDGHLHVPVTSTTNNGKVLTAGATAGSLSWQTPTVGTVTSVTAGAGMTQTGTSTINPTLNVIANGDGSIVVNADDIQVGTVDGGTFV